MRFVAAPEYPVFPTRERPLKPYEAVVLATARDAPGGRVVRARRGRARHPHARAGAGRRARADPGRDADPARVPGGGAGLPPYAVGARMPRTAAGRRCGARLTRSFEPGVRRGRDELNETRAPARPATGGAAARRDQRAAVPGRHVPAARVPARAGPRRPRRRAAAVGAAVRAAWSRLRASAAGAGGAVDRPGPRAPAAARRARRAWPASRCGCWRRGTGGRCRCRSRCRQRAAGRVGVLLAARCPSATLVICHAGHGTLVRALACGCPWWRAPRRRHGRERGPGRLGRGRGAAAVAAAEPADAAAGGAAGAGGPRAGRAGAGARRPGRRVNDGAERAASWSRSWLESSRSMRRLGERRTYSISSGASLCTRSIGSPVQLHRSITACSSVTSQARQIAPFSVQRSRSSILTFAATVSSGCASGAAAGGRRRAGFLPGPVLRSRASPGSSARRR